MKTSVVLSAYNGEKYILEQLESIRIQTVPVDEVLIIDDCSTDNTMKICTDFITKYHLSNWSLSKNPTNRGFVANFHDGFYKAKGDVIFICDQDDRWRRNKVERTLQLFERYPSSLSICSGFSTFNENGVIREHAKVPNRKKNRVKQITFAAFCYFHNYLGMTTAFKKELLQLHYSECIKHITYDISINLLASISNGLYYVDEVLVDRRQYMSTSVRIREESTYREFHGNYRLYGIYCHLTNLKEFDNYITRYLLKGTHKKIVLSFIIATELRYKYVKNKSLASWLRHTKFVIKTYSIKHYLLDGMNIINQILH